MFLTLSEPDARLQGNQVPLTVMSNQSSSDCINIYKRSILLDGRIVYRLWPAAPSSALPINPLYSRIMDLKQWWKKKKKSKRLIVSLHEIRGAKMMPVNEMMPPGFRAKVLTPWPRETLSSAWSVRKRRRCVLSADAPVLRGPKKEVINSPSRQTFWHSCHRSRTSGGGTGSGENRTLPANTLTTPTNGTSETGQRFSVCSAVCRSLCPFVLFGLL